MSQFRHEPCCPDCGYNRSGDHSPVCPECGSVRRPDAGVVLTAGNGPLHMLTLCASIWVMAYVRFTREAYARGVFRSDRGLGLFIAITAAALAAATFLSWRRRARVAEIPIRTGMVMMLVLLLAAFGGVLLFGAGDVRD